MELFNLTGDQRLYLQTVFDYFHIHGKWPMYSHLKQIFRQVHPDLNLREIVKGLPSGFASPYDLDVFDIPDSTEYEFYAADDSPHSRAWSAFLSSANKAHLIVSAISLCRGSEEDLTDFVRAIRFCIERYSSPNKNDRHVSSSDLISQLGMSELSARKVGLLLQVEHHIFTSFSTNGESWECTLHGGIRKFREVETIEQYLKKVEALENEVKGMSLTSEATQYSVVVTEMGNLEIHPIINARCWHLYTNRKYDEAILNATKALEYAVRRKAHLPNASGGADLMSKAFNPHLPILRYSTVDAEQEDMMLLLRGMIRIFKNPQSHRFVGVQSKSECLGMLLTCSNLLYVIQNAEFVG